MQIFLFTFLVLLLAFFGMAMGVILNNRELKGSCGGYPIYPGLKVIAAVLHPAKNAKPEWRNNRNSAIKMRLTNIIKIMIKSILIS